MARYKRVCDLCGAEKPEFTVMSKHLGCVLKNLKEFDSETDHITKHICTDCFLKIFKLDIFKKSEEPTFKCWKCGKELPISEMSNICYPSNPPKYSCKVCEGNPTIEQNTGENRIEGGVLSVSGSVSEKHYRQFEDTAELMVHYSKHFNIDFPPFYEPIIWVKRKDNDSRFLITGYDELDVFLEDCWQDLNDLYEQYVFLDGSCIGKEE